MAEWEAQKDRLEANLTWQIPEMNLEQRLRNADRVALAQAMPLGVTLVEIVRFNVFDFTAVPARGERCWQPARYLAFVVPAGESDNVQMVDLGEAKEIDKLVEAFRESLIRSGAGRVGMQQLPAQAPYRTNGRDLRVAVFDPLKNALGGCTCLFLSPDGALTRLPFEVLPLDDDQLLMDVYRISYLSTGRDVLRFEVQSSGQPTAPVVAADPDFDLAAGARLPDSVSLHPGHEVRSASRRSRDLDRTRMGFDRLPGSRIEGERIAAKLGVEPWLDHIALEARLKACNSPRILHLATHGYFLSDQEYDLNKTLHALGLPGWHGGNGPDRFTRPGMENPMLRSMLALAGANTWLKDDPLPPEAEDGLLTAEDVSGLNLLSTDLVVLSACETGLGDVRTGEGVFGLRRAFMLAGAKTLVMSLWKVHDLATAVLMERFYDNLLTHKLPRDEALHDAQRYTRDLTVEQLKNGGWLTEETIERLAGGREKIRKELQQLAQQPDEHRPFEHPYYWGAFICQGDPRPLPDR